MFNQLFILLTILIGYPLFAQDETRVQLTLTVYETHEKKITRPEVDVTLFSVQDTFTLRTNQNGQIICATNDGLKTIEMNQTYYYFETTKGPYSLDSFHTKYTENTDLKKDISPTTAICTRTINPLEFIGKTTDLSPQGKIDFERLSTYIETEESLVLELRGQYNQEISGLLAIERANKIRDSLIYQGHYPDRLKVGKPVKTEHANAAITFSILSTAYTPCTGGSVVNFIKSTDSIIETRCDSLHFIANYINIQEDNFAIIGIYTDKEDPVSKKNATVRAELVRKKLIALGIQKNRLKISTSYHKPPGENDHYDWPFYPESYNYEIGVYILADY